ncbi:L-type lectin-domain containing receptor kinase IX.1-like protein [Tanacetum coccineum]
MLHLWDAASGQLADFTTHFSVSRHGSDRLSFFLAHSGSQLVPFVAVEFDTPSNSNWDPVDGPLLDHVGINVNSSVELEKWWSNVSYGNQYFVKIQYDSGSQNLSVFYRGTIVGNQFELHYTVDIKNVLPEWVVFGFSSSSSSSSGSSKFHRNSVKSWFFNSTLLPMDNKRLKKKEKNKLVYIVTVSVVILLLMFFIGGFYIFLCLRKKTRANDQAIDTNTGGGPVAATNSWIPRRFTYEELSLATDNFNRDRMLGEGGFGVVYIATLTTRETVAVKKIRGTSPDGIKQYEAEVKTVGRACHRNLLRVVGWCEQDAELFVVYEFMENSSLDAHLFDLSRESLGWNVRYNIALGLAKAVRYLHNECAKFCILHRDIKAANVLLDSNFEAKLGDFGLAKLLDPDRSLEIMSNLAGTPGYIDPEYLQTGIPNTSLDVYSYGMVVLEIVTGRRCTGPINADQDDQNGLANWVRNQYTNGNIQEIGDPRLEGNFIELQLRGLVALGLWCISPDYSRRPPDINHLAYILDHGDQDAFSLVPNFESPSYLRRAWMCITSFFTK